MVTFEYIFYIVLCIIGNIIFINIFRKFIRFMNDKHIHSNNTIFDGSASALSQSNAIDNDCNDSSLFDDGYESCGGDGGGY